MTVLKAALRALIAAVSVGALAVLILPILIGRGVWMAWGRFELWLYYDGDAAARDRDRWRNS